MDEEIIKEIIEYVEQMEYIIDGEWGSCRTRKQLIKDGAMPDFYHELKKGLDKGK